MTTDCRGQAGVAANANILRALRNLTALSGVSGVDLDQSSKVHSSCANDWESVMVVRILYRVPAIDVPPSTLCEPCLKSENHVLGAAATEYLRLGVGFRTYASSTGHDTT